MTPSTPNRISEPLSPIDAAWYQLDKRGRTLDIGALLLFDEPLEFGQLREMAVEGLMPRRRFRRRVVEKALGVRTPHWEVDPHFRLDAHLHHLRVPAPADDDELAELVSDLMSKPMDRDRPLWELYLLDRGGRGSAILARIHHCMGDGFALGHLLLSLGTPEQGEWQGAGEGSDSEHHRRWMERIGELILHPEQAVDEARQGARAAQALGHLVRLPFDSKTFLSRPLSDIRRAAWSKMVELERVKGLGRRFDATVNDILMTALSGALRAYLIDAGEPVSELNLRAIMPVNLRPARFLEEMTDELGNHFGLVFVDLPIYRTTPAGRLADLKSTIGRLKQSPEAVVAFGVLQALGHTPAFFEHLVEDIFIKKASLVASNVPGPRQPLYFGGRRLKDVLFWPPHPGHLGLGMSIMSYAGRIRIGIRSDVDIIDDPARLARYFYDEFEEIEKMAQ